MSVLTALRRERAAFYAKNTIAPRALVLPAEHELLDELMGEFASRLRFQVDAEPVAYPSPLEVEGCPVWFGPVDRVVALGDTPFARFPLPSLPTPRQSTGERVSVIRALGAAIRQWCPEAADHLEAYDERA